MRIEEDKSTSRKFFNKVEKTWKWIWNSDSLLSWIVALILIFIFIKFIFFPSLSLITGTSLPLAGVESSSMDHQVARDDSGRYGLCGEPYSAEEKGHIGFDEYWEKCGDWYETQGISKQDFSEFSLSNGFQKGDIVVVWGRFEPKIGDIIIFQPNPDSNAPRPIVHRIVNIREEGGEKIYETKGDHNQDQLTTSNNSYKTDETNITEDQIIGKVIFRVPLLGWFKIWITELFNGIFR